MTGWDEQNSPRKWFPVRKNGPIQDEAHNLMCARPEILSDSLRPTFFLINQVPTWELGT